MKELLAYAHLFALDLISDEKYEEMLDYYRGIIGLNKKNNSSGTIFYTKYRIEGEYEYVPVLGGI